jgi:hypothetical protein
VCRDPAPISVATENLPNHSIKPLKAIVMWFYGLGGMGSVEIRKKISTSPLFLIPYRGRENI